MTLIKSGIHLVIITGIGPLASDDDHATLGNTQIGYSTYNSPISINLNFTGVGSFLNRVTLRRIVGMSFNI